MIYLISFLYIVLFKKKKSIEFLINIPLIDAIHNVLPGKGIGGHYIPPIILILAILINQYKKKINLKLNINKALFFFIIQIVFRLFFHNKLEESFINIFEYLTTLLVFIFFYSFFSNRDNLDLYEKKFLKSCFNGLIIWNIGLFIAKAFTLRGDYYYSGLEIKTYLGGAGFFSLFPLVYLSIFFLVYYINLNKKIYAIALLILTSIFFLMLGKRTYIYLLFVGVAISFMGLSKKYRKLIIALLILFSLIVVPYILEKGSSIRSGKGSVDYYTSGDVINEGRIQELILYPEIMRRENNLFIVLFGENLFSKVTFFLKSMNIYGDERQLHSDFTNILYGTGILGLINYLIILGLIFWNYIKNRQKGIYGRNILHEFVFLGFSLVFFMDNFTDGILSISNRLIPFIIFGYFSGYFVVNKNIHKGRSNVFK